MLDRVDVASWLDGPGAERPDPNDYPGHRLGIPERGSGLLARFGRRLAAVFVDWLLCTVIAAGLLSYRLSEGGLGLFKPLGILVLMSLLLVGTLGFTVGQRLLGIRVVRIEQRPQT